MHDNNQKIFRDPIHGYISIPRDLCHKFIDTEIFQRLRSIEQTSMRCLYPSARHDRFAHSIGVYHLASIAFHHVVKNTRNEILDGVALNGYKRTFLIAALMHDCAHSPFSHTLESHYNLNSNAKNYLFSKVNSSFKEDYISHFDTTGNGAAPHELFSAAILLDKYSSTIDELDEDIDKVLIARMITGCLHASPITKEKQIENCLIKLINGPLDVDKLDYIVRDTWASGVNNVSIDIHRLLSSIEIHPDDTMLQVAFRKSALSVIQSVINGRNYLYRWIYSHHIVIYFHNLLQNAFINLNKVFSKKDNVDNFISMIFSKGVFSSTKIVSKGHYKASLYLPSDADLIYLFKKFQNKIPESKEMLSRMPEFVPLWKCQTEFEDIFQKRNTAQRAQLKCQCKSQDTGAVFNFSMH
jgi:uncharacterized protein